MTSLLELRTELAARTDGRPTPWQALPGAARAASMLVVLAVWALPVTHGLGGRDPWMLGLGLLALLPALVLLRPWSSVPTWHTCVAVGPALAALVVCLTTPTGFDGLDELAALVAAAGTYLVVRAWADTARRRRWALALLALVGLEQYYRSYLAWWGSGSVSHPMVGTFAWHNQFSIFMVVTGLSAAVFVVRGARRLRIVGWAVAPWCLSALLFAGSRAGLACFLLVWALVVTTGLVDRRGRIAALLLGVVTLGLASFLASPLMMADGGWLTATLRSRGSAESLSGNGRARLNFWHAALDVATQHPLTGAGFDSFSGASAVHMPLEQGLSPFVHNGYLQAFSDGGLLLLVTVCVATFLPLVAGLRGALVARRRSADEVTALAVGGGLLALVLHSGVDFDWAYPSLIVLFAALAGLLPSRSLDGTGAGRSRAGRGTAGLVAVLLLALVVAALPAALRASGLRAPGAEVPRWARAAALGVPLHGSADWLPAASPCRSELYSPDPATVRHGLSCTGRAADDDPGLALLRAQALSLAGDTREALRITDETIGRYGGARPSLHILEAEVLDSAGHPDQAIAVLESARPVLARGGGLGYLPQVDELLARLRGEPR